MLPTAHGRCGLLPREGSWRRLGCSDGCSHSGQSDLEEQVLNLDQLGGDVPEDGRGARLDEKVTYMSTFSARLPRTTTTTAAHPRRDPATPQASRLPANRRKEPRGRPSQGRLLPHASTGAAQAAGTGFAACAFAQAHRCRSAEPRQPRDDRIPGERSSRRAPSRRFLRHGGLVRRCRRWRSDCPTNAIARSATTRASRYADRGGTRHPACTCGHLIVRGRKSRVP